MLSLSGLQTMTFNGRSGSCSTKPDFSTFLRLLIFFKDVAVFLQVGQQSNGFKGQAHLKLGARPFRQPDLKAENVSTTFP
jgi:hypothetical protein